MHLLAFKPLGSLAAGIRHICQHLRAAGLPRTTGHVCVWSNASTSTATSGHRGSGIRSSLFLQMAYHLRALGHTKRHDYIVKQTGRTHNNDYRFILKILHNDKTMNYKHVPLSFGREMVQLKVYSPIYCKSEMERTHIRTAEYSRLTLRIQRFQTTLHNDDGRVRCK